MADINFVGLRNESCKICTSSFHKEKEDEEEENKNEEEKEKNRMKRRRI